MIIRTKSGELPVVTAPSMSPSVLLDFLGVKKDAAGVQKVAGDVELIASVPLVVNPHPCGFTTLSFCDAKTPAKAVETAASLPPDVEAFAWTLSTFDLDRFGERIDPQGWDFNRYKQNPVVEWAHRYDIPAIGKIEGLIIDDDGLHGLVYFNDKSFDPFGWSIGQRVKAGVIRAGSVGFRVIEIEIPDKAMTQDGTSLIFRKQELLEFSICNVPANPFALAKISNEQLAVSNVNNATPFWNGLINNL